MPSVATGQNHFAMDRARDVAVEPVPQLQTGFSVDYFREFPHIQIQLVGDYREPGRPSPVLVRVVEHRHPQFVQFRLHKPH